jgi:hypothetical protein
MEELPDEKSRFRLSMQKLIFNQANCLILTFCDVDKIE